MERIDALKELAAKVEAGEVGFEGFCPLWHDSGLCVEAEGAYHGSLDAAKALHEAVLGDGYVSYGFKYCIRGNGYAGVWNVITDERAEAEIPEKEHHAASPARAWLLATLRALIAMEEAK